MRVIFKERRLSYFLPQIANNNETAENHNSDNLIHDLQYNTAKHKLTSAIVLNVESWRILFHFNSVQTQHFKFDLILCQLYLNVS